MSRKQMMFIRDDKIESFAVEKCNDKHFTIRLIKIPPSSLPACPCRVTGGWSMRKRQVTTWTGHPSIRGHSLPCHLFIQPLPNTALVHKLTFSYVWLRFLS